RLPAREKADAQIRGDKGKTRFFPGTSVDTGTRVRGPLKGESRVAFWRSASGAVVAHGHFYPTGNFASGRTHGGPRPEAGSVSDAAHPRYRGQIFLDYLNGDTQHGTSPSARQPADYDARRPNNSRHSP